MERPVKLLICLKPLICKNQGCERINPAGCIHYLKMDDFYLATTNPINEKVEDENSVLQPPIIGRRVSGNTVSNIEKYGIEDMVIEMLQNKNMTLSDIKEAVFASTGKRISISSLSRYNLRIKRGSSQNKSQMKITPVH